MSGSLARSGSAPATRDRSWSWVPCQSRHRMVASSLSWWPVASRALSAKARTSWGMELPGVGEGLEQVDGSDAALQHAVGDQDQPVAAKQGDPRAAVVGGRETGRRGGRPATRGRYSSTSARYGATWPALTISQVPTRRSTRAIIPVTKSSRPRVAAWVGQRRGSLRWPAPAAWLLFAGCLAGCQAQRRRQRRSHPVTHRVGQRQMQPRHDPGCSRRCLPRCSLPVPTTRERERSRLTGTRTRKQTLLDLRGQAEGTAALAPLEQIGVPLVGDHDEREQVRDLPDLAAVSGAGSSSRYSSRRPMDSPRSVTGASTRHHPRTPSPTCAEPGSNTWTTWVRTACSAGPPSKGSVVADSSSSRRSPWPSGVRRSPSPPTSGTCAKRTRARPDRSAMRKDTAAAWKAAPSSRATAATASTGDSDAAASSTRPTSTPRTDTICRSIDVPTGHRRTTVHQAARSWLGLLTREPRQGPPGLPLGPTSGPRRSQLRRLGLRSRRVRRLVASRRSVSMAPTAAMIMKLIR